MATAAQKKRLGQYFTGTRLARLLAALADARNADSIIDPMAGCGDMLEGSLAEGARPNVVGAIDVDPQAYQACKATISKRTVKNTSILLGSAFNVATLRRLPSLAWDLVITNPPYVRYQSLTETGEFSDLQIPNASQVREGLLAALELMPSLDHEDRRLFKELAEHYSGLADLAVPSWILCAALVRKGGTLAMVVPESWLSRDYALVVQYLLLRWFRIRYVIEDSHAAWFPGTLIKTTLLIAERIPRRDSAFSPQNEHFLHVALPSETINEQSIVGGLFPNDPRADRTFATGLEQYLSGKTPSSLLPVSVERVPLEQVAHNVRRASQRQQWLRDLDPSKTVGDHRGHLPPRLSTWLDSSMDVPLTTLEALGARIGQGLRTGANIFFYADALRTTATAVTIMPSKLFRVPPLKVPRACALPVLRKQSELPEGSTIDASKLNGRVLVFHDYALPEDAASRRHRRIRLTYKPLRGAVADLLRIAAKTRTRSKKLIPTLSAVAPNARRAKSEDSASLPRFWYMLPNFAHRHRPDIAIPRINTQGPKAFLNKDRAALVDANFSSIWLEDKDSGNRHAVLALLNSSWVTAVLELSASVMGGGALKVEAAHLRKVPLPQLSSRRWFQLRHLGIQLVKSGRSQKVIDRIDDILVESLVGQQRASEKLKELRSICAVQLAKRTRK